MISKAIRMLGRKMARYGLHPEKYPDETVDMYYDTEIGGRTTLGAAPTPELQFGPQMFFKIYAASGGYILEFRKPYDPYTTKSNGSHHDESPSVYVIQQDADITEEIAIICKNEFIKL